MSDWQILRDWQPIDSNPPKGPTAVLFFLGNAKYRDVFDNAVPADDARAERVQLGYWNGEWRWAGTGHAVSELPASDDFYPTHFMPLPAPPPEAA